MNLLQHHHKIHSLLNGPSDDQEEPEYTSVATPVEKKLEVFDAPTYENSFVEQETEEEPQDEGNSGAAQEFEDINAEYNNELSSSNTFFTPIVERKEIELINREEEDIDPMANVDKISSPYNDAKINASEKNLKDAISQIRSCIQNLGNKGFYINVEEIDFDTNYQITIQINKDN